MYIVKIMTKKSLSKTSNPQYCYLWEFRYVLSYIRKSGLQLCMTHKLMTLTVLTKLQSSMEIIQLISFLYLLFLNHGNQKFWHCFIREHFLSWNESLDNVFILSKALLFWDWTWTLLTGKSAFTRLPAKNNAWRKKSCGTSQGTTKTLRNKMPCNILHSYRKN